MPNFFHEVTLQEAMSFIKNLHTNVYGREVASSESWLVKAGSLLKRYQIQKSGEHQASNLDKCSCGAELVDLIYWEVNFGLYKICVSGTCEIKTKIRPLKEVEWKNLCLSTPDEISVTEKIEPVLSVIDVCPCGARMQLRILFDEKTGFYRSCRKQDSIDPVEIHKAQVKREFLNYSSLHIEGVNHGTFL